MSCSWQLYHISYMPIILSSFSRLLVLCPIFRHQTRSINLRHMQCSVTPINKSYIVGYGPMDIQSYPKYIPIGWLNHHV